MGVVRSLMKTDIVTAAPAEKVREVARRMQQRQVGAVLIVDGEKLAGIFSERDLLNRVVAPDKNGKTTVGEVATRDVVAVDAQTSIRRCAQILKDKGCRHLPITEHGKPVGIISARDFFEHVVDGLERFIDQQRYQAQLDEGIDPYDHFGGGYDK
jgi:CBS domain-containing protein